LATQTNGAPMCVLKAMRGFYCDSLCSTSCTSFLAEGGDGESLTSSSSNDESTPDGSDGGDEMPDFMLNESELNKMCSNSCLIDLLKSMASTIEGLGKCSVAESSLSSNDGAAPGSPAVNPTAMTTMIEQGLGRMCVKNDKNQFCATELMAFQKNNPKKPTEISCKSQAVKDLVGLGCCFGSIVAMSAMAPEEQGDQKDISEMSYWVGKCGGSIAPCSAGSIKDVSLVSSSILISADGLTQAALEKPSVINAFRKGIATAITKPESAILVQKITVQVMKSVRGRRSLGTSTAQVDYAVMTAATDADAVQNSIKAIDNNALTSGFQKDAAFADLSTNLSAEQSKDVTNDVTKASPGSGGGNAASPAATAVLVAIALAGALL